MEKNRISAMYVEVTPTMWSLCSGVNPITFLRPTLLNAANNLSFSFESMTIPVSPEGKNTCWYQQVRMGTYIMPILDCRHELYKETSCQN